MRTVVVRVVSFLAAGALLLTTMAVATSAPGTVPAGVDVRLGAALDALEAVPGVRTPPVSGQIIDAFFGVGTTEPPGGEPDHVPPEPTGDGSEPDPEGTPDPVERVTAEPDLRVTMRADHATARPGDTIRYTITLVNVGRGIAKDVVLISHIPEHTTWIEDGSCGGTGVHETDSSVGYTAVVCGPPSPQPGTHGVRVGYDSFRPGIHDSFTFSVLVADPPAGTVLRNHAHVDALRHPRRTSAEVMTRVDDP